MKKLIIIISALTLTTNTFADNSDKCIDIGGEEFCAKTQSSTESANYDDGSFVHFYGGANLTLSHIDQEYDKEVVSYTPKFFWGGGVYGGIKLGKYNDIYNGGIDVFYNVLASQKLTTSAEHGLPLYKYAASEVSFATLMKIAADYEFTGISYDSYFRLLNPYGRRIDLVLGIGYAKVVEKIKIDWNTSNIPMEEILSVLLSDPYGITYEGDSMMLKFGGAYKLLKNLDMQIMAKYYIYTGKVEDEDMSNPFTINIGFNLSF